MNRRSFFRELARSLTETGKEIVSPILEHDLEKIDQAATILQGLSWLSLPAPIRGYQEQMVNGKLIGIYYDGRKALAFDKKCPHCRSLVQWQAFEQKIYCPACSRTYSFQQNEGALQLSFYSLRRDEKGWWVALPE
ncbi:MAG: Rieske (2Fe-2S) protein [Sporolactobacillus sp.]